MTTSPAPDESTVGSVDPPLKGMPRWVKVIGVIVLLLIAVVVVVALTRGGSHGPGRHGPQKHSLQMETRPLL